MVLVAALALRLAAIGALFVVNTPLHDDESVGMLSGDEAYGLSRALRTRDIAIGAPVSLSQMAARARMIANEDVTPDCARVTAPTLVVTGEAGLDHVVPVEGSSEYLRLIPNARAVMLERTGHLGSITRPEAFAAIVREFIDGHRHAAA
jgi:pimeloyl-ACP methyl ester carboxylesterase